MPTQKYAIAPPDSGREAELVNAQARKAGTKDYYILEYAVKFPNQLRHNLASVVISRGQLFTINISATEAVPGPFPNTEQQTQRLPIAYQKR